MIEHHWDGKGIPSVYDFHLHACRAVNDRPGICEDHAVQRRFDVFTVTSIILSRPVLRS
jgi:hypothetical protein